MTVRVELPLQLRRLARVSSAEVKLEVGEPATQRAVLDALEDVYPMLRGTVREHGTRKRRPYVRFYACGEDLSHQAPDTPLPDSVAAGHEPFVILGAMSGG